MLTETVRTCALAGCNLPVPERPGRPVPTYCSASHRARAREARRAARYGVPAVERLDGDPGITARAPVPWQPEPARKPSAGSRRRGPASLAAKVRRQQATVRREVGRKALASLGAAGIVVAAGGFAVSSGTERQAQQALAQLGPNAFAMESGHEWAYQANITLASHNRQIDELTLADQRWRVLDWADPTMPAVRDLQSHLALLNQQRTILVSQLAAWDSFQRSQGDLAAAEAQLARADRALRESPTDARTNPQLVAAQQQLVAIRDLRRERRDAKSAERDSLQRAVATAVQNPVPDEPGRTAAVAGAVLDIDGNPPPPPANAQQRQVPAVAPRDGSADRPRADVDTGAPPRGTSGDDLVGTVAATGDNAVEGTTSGVREVGETVTGGSAGSGSGGSGATEPVARGTDTVQPRSAPTPSAYAPATTGSDSRAAEAAVAYGMAWAAATGYPAAAASDSTDSSDYSSSPDYSDSSDYSGSSDYSSTSDYPESSDYSYSSDSSDSSSESSDSSDSSGGSNGYSSADYAEAAHSMYEASTG